MPGFANSIPRLTGRLAFEAAAGVARAVQQLLDEVPLVMDDNRVPTLDRSLWFAGFGVHDTDQRRTKFNGSSLPLQAACKRPGVALGWSLLTDDMLARGAPVRPVSASLRPPGGCYLAIAEKYPVPGVREFRDWLIRQFPLAEPEQDWGGKLSARQEQRVC